MATFGGVTFKLMIAGLSDEHSGMVTVRDIPGSSPPVAYVDAAGRSVHRRKVSLRLETEASYVSLSLLVGTSGTLVSPPEADATVVLRSIDRYWRKGTGVQLCHSEWVYLT